MEKMDSKQFKKISTWIGVSVIFICILGSIYYLGYEHGTQQTRNITVEGVTDPLVSKDGTDFTPFWEAWSVIKSKFVSHEKAYDNQTLMYGAIKGMVDSLDDPNTNFFSPQDASDFNEEISGQFSGIGAEIGMDENNNVVIIAPLKDTPAFRAGAQAGDRILKIDGENTTGFNTEDAVKRIRGEQGTRVLLNILRDGKELELAIIRDIIELPTLETKRLNKKGEEDTAGDITYIRLYNFYEKASSQFRQAAIRAAGQKTKGIILDLRNNPGGYLDAAVEIAGWFVPQGEVVVREEFQDASQNEIFVSRGPAALKNIPIIVLLDRGSASASEILAGALREKDNALIMGEKSFGKGTVQELIPLLDDSMVKVTIAHWLTPNGTPIDKNGILPDIQLEIPTTTDPDDDPWLSESLRELLKRM